MAYVVMIGQGGVASDKRDYRRHLRQLLIGSPCPLLLRSRPHSGHSKTDAKCQRATPWICSYCLNGASSSTPDSEPPRLAPPLKLAKHFFDRRICDIHMGAGAIGEVAEGGIGRGFALSGTCIDAISSVRCAHRHGPALNRLGDRASTYRLGSWAAAATAAAAAAFARFSNAARLCVGQL